MKSWLLLLAARALQRGADWLSAAYWGESFDMDNFVEVERPGGPEMFHDEPWGDRLNEAYGSDQ